MLYNRYTLAGLCTKAGYISIINALVVMLIEQIDLNSGSVLWVVVRLDNCPPCTKYKYIGRPKKRPLLTNVWKLGESVKPRGPANTSISFAGRVREGKRFFLSVMHFEFSTLYNYKCLISLVALMLGRLQMTTDKALRTYNSLARAIFSKDNRKSKGQEGLFKATTLEKKVQEGF